MSEEKAVGEARRKARESVGVIASHEDAEVDELGVGETGGLTEGRARKAGPTGCISGKGVVPRPAGNKV